MDKKIIVSLGVDTSGVSKGMSKAQQTVNQGTNGMVSGFKKATSGVSSFISGVSRIAGALGVFKLLDSAVNMITQGIDRGISRFDTLNRFPKIMEQYGVSAEEAEASIGRLSDGIEGLPTTLDDIASSTQQLMPILGSLELAESTALAFNNAMIAAGASTSDVSRATQQYNQMLSTGTVDMQSWRTLMETMPGPLNQVAEEMLGTGSNALDLYDAIKSGDITLEEFNNKMIEMSEATGGFADQAQTASKSIRTSFGNMVNAISKGVADILETLNEWSQDTTGMEISEHIDQIKFAINGFFDYINANLPGVLDSLNELWELFKDSTTFQTFSEGMGIIKEGFGELREEFENSEAFETLKNTLKEIGEALLEIDFTALAEGFMFIVDLLAPIVIPILNQLVNAFALLWQVIQILGTIFGDVFGMIKNWFDENGQYITDTINNMFDDEETATSMSEMGNTVLNGWNAIKGIVEAAINFVLWVVTFTLAILTGDWSTAWDMIKNILSIAWDFIKAKAKEGIVAVKNWISSKVDEIRAKWNNAWDSIKNYFSQKWEEIKSKARTAVSDVVSTIRGKISEMKTAGRDLITGLWNGIKAKFDEVIDLAVGLANNLVSKVKGALGIASPSKIFRDIGEFLVEGLMDGIDNLSGKAMRQMESFSKGIIDEADGIAPGVNNSLNALDPDVSFKGNTSLNAQLDKLKDRDYTPVVHVHVSDGDIYLDGEKVGKQVAPTVKKENDKVKGMRDRSKGINSNFGGVFG